MLINCDRIAAVSNETILDDFCKAKPRRLEIERLSEMGNSTSLFLNQIHVFSVLDSHFLFIPFSSNFK